MAKTKTEEALNKAEDEAVVQKKAEKDAISEKKAEEETTEETTERKKAEEQEASKRATNETEKASAIAKQAIELKTNGSTFKKMAPRVPTVMSNEPKQQANIPAPFNLDTIKSLSSTNQVRIVTGLATSFSALVFLRSFLMDRTDKQEENSKSAILQAMERAGLGERAQKKSKPYTKVPTTQKIDITAADQMAAKPQAGTASAKAKALPKAKGPAKPKPKPTPKQETNTNTASKSNIELPGEESVPNVDLTSKSEPRSEPTKSEDTKTNESSLPKKKMDTTKGLYFEKVDQDTTQKVLQTKGEPTRTSPPSTSSKDENQTIKPSKTESKPSRPFLGGSSSYLDSL